MFPWQFTTFDILEVITTRCAAGHRDPSMVSLSARDRTVDTSLLLGQANGPFKVSYNTRDLLLYALGIGCSTTKHGNTTKGSPADELRFLYEEHAAGFRAFPTYPLVLPYTGTSSDVVHFPGGIGLVFWPYLVKKVRR